MTDFFSRPVLSLQQQPQVFIRARRYKQAQRQNITNMPVLLQMSSDCNHQRIFITFVITNSYKACQEQMNEKKAPYNMCKIRVIEAVSVRETIER